MVVVQNTPRIHNLIVCTLCSCYPWPVLGLPPVWYKSAPQHGMGPVEYERNEPVFHAPWEARVYALTRAMRAWRKWSLDADRHAPSSACRQSTICA